MTHTQALTRLKSASWRHQPATQRIFKLLDGEEKHTRAVGGVVRDSLLGRLRDSAEIDFATELLPEHVMSRAAGEGISAYPTGIEHGTVTLRVDDLMFEVTTLRDDVETDGRHAKVVFGTDWLRDAARRDFTLNALYTDMDGTLFDPLGGLGDCLAGKVKFIGDADQRIIEDRLRVYRFFRFSASHGDQVFDRRGLEACKNAADTLEALSAERVGVEMMRMLELPYICKTLRSLMRAGVLSLDSSLLQQLARYELSNDIPLAAGRLALFMGSKSPDEIQSMWRLSNAEIKAAIALRDAALLLSEGQVNEVAYRFADVAKTAVSVAAAMQDWSGAWQDETSDILRATRVPPFPIKGNDLMEAGLKPGPALGRKLHRLERDWIESGFRLNRRELLARVKLD